VTCCTGEAPKTGVAHALSARVKMMPKNNKTFFMVPLLLVVKEISRFAGQKLFCAPAQHDESYH
jgi:hypothetical protein